MTKLPFKPILYLKQNCPFCLKVRIFLLEAGLLNAVDILDFAPGTPEEEAIRAELLPEIAKPTFPTAQLVSGHYVTESDDIVAELAAMHGHDTTTMTVYRNYVDGPFAMVMALWKENQALKQASGASD